MALQRIWLTVLPVRRDVKVKAGVWRQNRTVKVLKTASIAKSRTSKVATRHLRADPPCWLPSRMGHRRQSESPHSELEGQHEQTFEVGNQLWEKLTSTRLGHQGPRLRPRRDEPCTGTPWLLFPPGSLLAHETPARLWTAPARLSQVVPGKRCSAGIFQLDVAKLLQEQKCDMMLAQSIECLCDAV